MSKTFASAVTGLALCLSLSAVTPAAAYAPHRGVSSLPEPVTVAALTPLSMQYFCSNNPSECRTGGTGQVTATPNLMAALRAVNVQVNRAIRPKADTDDVWSLNPASGDCEDYALSKRSALIAKGVPAGALRIAYTKTRAGEPHAVLVVRTSQGDYVLDNLTNAVRTVRQSGYDIRSISNADPMTWSVG